MVHGGDEHGAWGLQAAHGLDGATATGQTESAKAAGASSERPNQNTPPPPPAIRCCSHTPAAATSSWCALELPMYAACRGPAALFLLLSGADCCGGLGHLAAGSLLAYQAKKDATSILSGLSRRCDTGTHSIKDHQVRCAGKLLLPAAANAGCCKYKPRFPHQPNSVVRDSGYLYDNYNNHIHLPATVAESSPSSSDLNHVPTRAFPLSDCFTFCNCISIDQHHDAESSGCSVAASGRCGLDLFCAGARGVVHSHL